MFRNPRENSARGTAEALAPSTGRAPTPPPQTSKIPKINSSPYFGQSATPTPELAGMLANLRSQSQTGFGPFSRQAAVTKKPVPRPNNGKTKGSRPNQSILSFFGKAEKKPNSEDRSTDEEALFFKDSKYRGGSHDDSTTDRSKSPGLFSDQEEEDDLNGDLRYNELESPFKKRKTSGVDVEDIGQNEYVATEAVDTQRCVGNEGSTSDAFTSVERTTAVARKPVRHLGGFIDESSSDEENDPIPPRPSYDTQQEYGNISEAADSEGIAATDEGGKESPAAEVVLTMTSDHNSLDDGVVTNRFHKSSSLKISDGGMDLENCRTSVSDPATVIRDVEPLRPTLVRESTSLVGDDEFENDNDFEDDDFIEHGEEMMERRWMEEQRRLEMDFDEDSKSESEEEAMTPNDPVDQSTTSTGQDMGSCCPVCNVSLHGTTEAQASSHVNACLDGNPTPLQTRQETASNGFTNETFTAAAAPKRFQRAAIARPGQENPFSLGKDGRASGSAFSRLMSGHAEDQAWTAAASNEMASRGKPAYQRTCPFYKIMPGMFICVDAFRYGKVEGQNAYFLSHFHSDHYVGLTSSWCHGPIYCSKVTANLVRQQLRVDPKWVVPLEYDKKVEVPDTKGVFVTMISANHCPGSSLFLFEKVLEKGPKGRKMNRILHCGDFRACPAHIHHPLLKPDVLDAITGQTKQQIIDTCYLDTTYLTPKYAFPTQEDVITACAQMCVSLSKDIVDSEDGWEKAKLARAGSTMTKFLEKGSTSESTPIQSDPDTEDVKPVKRGRLLVVCGTYSIGKERICVGIAKALNSKIYCPPNKMKICACLEDPELSALLTPHPLEAQVHMQMLMEIRAETLLDYLQSYKGAFERVVGFRPTGWNYRPPASRNSDNPAVGTVLHSEGWKSRFSMKDLAPQRGSTKESNCFGVPYSEHSSFRELSMFCCALRIGRIIPTVNVGSAKSREKMKGWVEKWDAEKRKNGLFSIEEGQTAW